jgi:hypothetical protein
MDTQDPGQAPNDVPLQNYQDSVDTSEDATDRVTEELTDNPAEELGVDEKEFADELNKYDFDEAGHGDDDMREEIESRDMENAEDISDRPS